MEPLCNAVLWNADGSWLTQCTLLENHEDPWHQVEDEWTDSDHEHVDIRWKEHDGTNGPST